MPIFRPFFISTGDFETIIHLTLTCRRGDKANQFGFHKTTTFEAFLGSAYPITGTESRDPRGPLESDAERGSSDRLTGVGPLPRRKLVIYQRHYRP